MERVEREIVVGGTAEETWRAMLESDWLGEDVRVDPRPGGEVEASEHTGFVEEADPPRRLAFWWRTGNEDATRVEIQLEECERGTLVRVTESRPLQLLDAYGPELELVLGVQQPGAPGAPEALAAV